MTSSCHRTNCTHSAWPFRPERSPERGTPSRHWPPPIAERHRLRRRGTLAVDGVPVWTSALTVAGLYRLLVGTDDGRVLTCEMT
jgi:hypothetical protein